jgi:hypothetical protein
MHSNMNDQIHGQGMIAAMQLPVSDWKQAALPCTFNMLYNAEGHALIAEILGNTANNFTICASLQYPADIAPSRTCCETAQATRWGVEARLPRHSYLP